MEQRKIHIGNLSGTDITGIGTVKLEIFLFCSVKCPGNPYACNAGFRFPVDPGNFSPVAGKGFHLPFADQNHKQQCDRKTGIYNQCQPAVDMAKHVRAYPQHHNGNKEVFRPMMRHLGYFLKIVGDPAHQSTGFIVIEEGNRQFFNMTKDIPAHICLHTDSKNMPPVGDDHVQAEFDDIDHRKRDGPLHHQRPALFRDIFVYDIPYDQRHEFVGQSDQKGTDQIQDKQPHMRPEIRKKSFEHHNLLQLPLIITKLSA